MKILAFGIIFLVGQLVFSNTGYSAEDSEIILREILVTAQKREENIQDVGITMSAFSAEDIKQNSLQNLADLTSLISNTELFQDYGSGGLPTWVIRGVGLQDFNSNNTPTAAVYIDEIYQTSTAMSSAGLFDIDRVEVLKGPQGGLYGRNTSGGAINLITRDPELGSNSGYFNFSYSRWQNTSLEAASNIAVNDTLAIRLAGRLQSSADAWQTSLATGSHHGEKDNFDLRGKLLFKPNDSFDFQLKIYGGEDNSDFQLGRSVGLYASQTNLCNAVLLGHRDESSCLDWASVNRLELGSEAILTSLQSENGSEVFSDPINSHSHDFFGITGTLNFDLAFARLTSLTTFDIFDYGVALDLDGATGEYGHRISSSDMEVWSQEFRLSSDDDSYINWLLGIAFSNDTFLEDSESPLIY